MQPKLNNELLTKFISELYMTTDFKDIEISSGAEIFLRYVKISNRISTYEFYKNTLQYMMEYLNSRKIFKFSQLNSSVLIDYAHFASKTLKNVTINKRVFVIKRMVNHLAEHSIISPIELKFPKLKEASPQIQIVNDINMERLFKHMTTKSPMNQISFLLLATTGIRRTELVNIKRKNINFKKNSIYLEHTKTGIPRYVYFDSYTKGLIEEFVKNTDNEYLIFNKQGNKVKAEVISKFLTHIKKELNIETLSPHKLRHTYATYLITNGADLESVRLLLGHTSYEMTKKYLHISSGNLKKTSIELNPISRFIKND